MGTFRRTSAEWPAGWQPSSDLLNGNPSGLLRADNLMLDDEGVIRLRFGSTPNFTAPGGEQNVDRLYTAVLNSSPTSLSVKHIVGVDNAIYINGARRDQGVNGSGDIAITSAFGQMFWTRGTTHKKNDGSEQGGDNGAGNRNWGIAKPTSAPSFESSDPDGATFATCDSDESPGFEVNVQAGDDGTGEFVEGHDGTEDGAFQLTADAKSGRGTATLFYGQGGARDFTVYDDGDKGIDEDLIEGYVKVSNPENLGSLTIIFGVNPDAEFQSVAFQDDYYWYTFDQDQIVKTKPPELVSTEDTNVSPDEVETLRTYKMNRNDQEGGSGQVGPTFTIRKDADWARFSVPRKSFFRSGGNSGRGWDTVIGIRFIATSLQPEFTFGQIGIDRITISGGANHPFTGTFTARYQWVKNFGNYVALSPASDASDPITTKANGLFVRIPNAAIAARDSQVNEVWVYLFGGALNGYYRFAAEEFTQGALRIDVNIREVQAVIANIVLDLNLSVPPDDIISLAGPHYGRFLALTPYGIHISQPNNPDTFSVNEVIKIGDGGEIPYWMVLSDGRILVGTSLTIWEVSGTLTRSPDGTIDARKTQINVPGPADKTVAVDGSVIGYIAADGPRLLVGYQSKLIVGGLDLLLRGETRYDVAPMNLGLAPGRTRMAIKDRFLFMVAPEFPYNDGSPVVYRYDMSENRWMRWVYPYTFRSIYKEPSNLLIAGTNDGRVVGLEGGTNDNGSPIAFELRTVAEAPGGALIKKDFHDIIVNLDSGHSNSPIQGVGIQFYKDDETTAAVNLLARGGVGNTTWQAEVTDLSGARRVAMKISGSSDTGFKFYDYSLNFRERPMARVRWDTGYTQLASMLGRELVWFRRLNVVANSPGDLSVQVYFSGVLDSTYTVEVLPNVTDVYWIPIGRECKGRQPLIVVTPVEVNSFEGQPPEPFELYKLGFQLRNTGTTSEMQWVDFKPEDSQAA